MKDNKLYMARQAAKERLAIKGISGDPIELQAKAVANITKPLVDTTYKIMLAKAAIEDSSISSGGIRAADNEFVAKALDVIDEMNEAVRAAMDAHDELKSIMRSYGVNTPSAKEEMEIPSYRSRYKRY